MMNKLIKPLLSLLLIGVVSCSSEPVLHIEQLDDSSPKPPNEIVEDSYQVGKNIYLYVAYDRMGFLHASLYPRPGCVFRIYNIEKPLSFTSVDQTLAYLNKIDTRLHPKWIASPDGKNKYDTEDGQLIYSIWFKQSELPDDAFNPFNVNLSEYDADSEEKITESPVKTAYDECLQFFFDGAEKQTYTSKYNLDFLEKYREDIPKQYQRSDFEAVLKDGESLVRLYYYCDGGRMFFLNMKHQLFATVSLKPRKKIPNPNCP